MVKHNVEHSERVGQQRLDSYLDALASALGHADREEPFGPIASVCCSTATARASNRWRRALIPNAFRPSISHCITSLLRLCGAMLLCWKPSADTLCRRSNATAWIMDDTGIPKKGRHLVGVARQYCGQLGKQDNCQVAVTLALANDRASLPVAYRLYLPEAWAG